MRSPSVLLAVAVFANLACIEPTRAQEWPSRPLTMVVPFAAGGGADLLGRILAPRLSDLLGQQVTVENVGGGGGTTGALRVARAAPDGYQFVLGSSGTHAQNQSLYRHPLYDAASDFAPVALIAEQPILLITRKDLPADNLAQFIAYTRANRDKMQFASAGTGSGVHLACVLLNAAIGVDVVHVPYRGSGPAMQDLIGGRIDYQCPVITPVVPQIQGHLVKAIATLTKNRTAVLPDLPTAQEQGLADFEAYIWFAIFLPKGTPADIIHKLQHAIAASENIPAVQKQLHEIGAAPIGPERATPEYLAGFVAREIEKWAAPIRASGIRVD
jgi:tripartite-type tricarboxylate transporter receptor subunit TctC